MYKHIYSYHLLYCMEVGKYFSTFLHNLEFMFLTYCLSVKSIFVNQITNRYNYFVLLKCDKKLKKNFGYSDAFNEQKVQI
jgi:hypothetical protein